MLISPQECSPLPRRKRGPCPVCHRVALTVTVSATALLGHAHPFVPRAPIWTDAPVTWSQLVLVPLAIVATGGFLYALVSSLRQ